MAQLAEGSLPMSEVHGSNPVMGNYCQLFKNENKEKDTGDGAQCILEISQSKYFFIEKLALYRHTLMVSNVNFSLKQIACGFAANFETGIWGA